MLLPRSHAIVSSLVGPEYYVNIMSFVDKTQLEPGCSILLHNKVSFKYFLCFSSIELHARCHGDQPDAFEGSDTMSCDVIWWSCVSHVAEYNVHKGRLSHLIGMTHIQEACNRCQ